MPTRPSWDQLFMEVAHVVAKRGTCDRKQVGCVVAIDRRVVVTGYNGSIPGQPHCDEVGHDLVQLADGSVNCVRTLHSEQNAVVQAARLGQSLMGGAMYVNTFPCWICAKLILAAGIARVVYDADYRNDERVARAFELAGAKLEKF